MSANGWRVADSDMHVMEPADLWERYIAAEWRHAAPIGLSELHRDMRVRVKDHSPHPHGPGEAELRRDGRVEARVGRGAAHRRKRACGTRRRSSTAMDEEGLDVAVLFPSRGLFVLGLDTTEHVGARRARARARGGDRPRVQRLAARLLQREDPTRCFGAGLLAPHDVDAAVDEVQARASNDSGSRPCSCTRAV